jgi:hypothetical protein
MQMSHGEILRKEVMRSGKSVSQTALDLGISRAWLYHLFEKDYFSTKDVITLSKLFPFSLSIHYLGGDDASIPENENSQDFWKRKYEQLLSEFEDLQKRHQTLVRMRR